MGTPTKVSFCWDPNSQGFFIRASNHEVPHAKSWNRIGFRVKRAQVYSHAGLNLVFKSVLATASIQTPRLAAKATNMSCSDYTPAGACRSQRCIGSLGIRLVDGRAAR